MKRLILGFLSFLFLTIAACGSKEAALPPYGQGNKEEETGGIGRNKHERMLQFRQRLRTASAKHRQSAPCTLPGFFIYLHSKKCTSVSIFCSLITM